MLLTTHLAATEHSNDAHLKVVSVMLHAPGEAAPGEGRRGQGGFMYDLTLDSKQPTALARRLFHPARYSY